MAVFGSRPFRAHTSRADGIGRILKRHPSYFGLPFVLVMVGGSFALSTFTQTRYDLHEKKVTQMSKEEELHMSKNRRHVDIREEYFRLQAQDDEDWEPVRVPRPPGSGDQ
ncbi:cytochrome C oxidase assembly protein COX16, mitochondrial [Rhizoctonia solani]|uniref:Cytochrome c oxidase assembly protein COX16, mitochondrial n=1 Tax=Rhizoctonia solani TaxID=456999 RepID=A0A8H8STC2_9AGAM|nr:cytochrome C oxidase assembly protein COX16, mitochondrial [Rhizoctonia solani]QRW17726.1 cytochrome C oxidase assembly protein COX16, mitochondrial [Rhizoctonia solani]